MAWIETKKTTGTSETDEDSSEPVAFALGENQSTPSANYSEVMNFDVNVRNTGYKTAYDVRVDMELSEDITKFPFEINDGNYDRQMGNMNPDQTVAIRSAWRCGKRRNPAITRSSLRSVTGKTRMETLLLLWRIPFMCGSMEKTRMILWILKQARTKRTKARIIVDSFETDPAEIYAGQDFTLKVRMKNASNSIVASNILFTFESEAVSDSPVFTTVNGSNSVVVNSLAPGAIRHADDKIFLKFLQRNSVPTRSRSMSSMTARNSRTRRKP